MGISAALYSGSKYYFFAGTDYVRVTRDDEGPGTVDPGYPRSITSGWHSFPAGFGERIDAALYTRRKYYFFDGPRYIRVSHNGIGPGTLDPGYPKPISPGWSSFPDGFGAAGIDAALNSGSRFFFFSGHEFIRVRHDGSAPGLLDPGFPRKISEWWGWPDLFGTE